MEITLANIENGYRITIKHSEDDIHYLDLPEDANCHNVIDAMYRIPEHALKHCLSEVAKVVEMLEGKDSFYENTDAHDALNELVVYIAGQLGERHGAV